MKEQIIIKPENKLPSSFIYKGDNFTRIEESESAYIFERMHANTAYYEVFNKKCSEILFDFEKKLGSGEFKERYPKDNDFGVWAWCFKSLDAAVEKFNTLK